MDLFEQFMLAGDGREPHRLCGVLRDGIAQVVNSTHKIDGDRYELVFQRNTRLDAERAVGEHIDRVLQELTKGDVHAATDRFMTAVQPEEVEDVRWYDQFTMFVRGVTWYYLIRHAANAVERRFAIDGFLHAISYPIERDVRKGRKEGVSADTEAAMALVLGVGEKPSPVIAAWINRDIPDAYGKALAYVKKAVKSEAARIARGKVALVYDPGPDDDTADDESFAGKDDGDSHDDLQTEVTAFYDSATDPIPISDPLPDQQWQAVSRIFEQAGTIQAAMAEAGFQIAARTVMTYPGEPKKDFPHQCLQGFLAVVLGGVSHRANPPEPWKCNGKLIQPRLIDYVKKKYGKYFICNRCEAYVNPLMDELGYRTTLLRARNALILQSGYRPEHLDHTEFAQIVQELNQTNDFNRLVELSARLGLPAVGKSIGSNWKLFVGQSAVSARRFVIHDRDDVIDDDANSQLTCWWKCDDDEDVQLRTREAVTATALQLCKLAERQGNWNGILD